MKDIKNAEILSVEDLLGGASPAVRTSYQAAEDALEGAALIRTMRTMAGFSKSDLARELAVKPARVSALEKGVGNQGPTYALLKRVARVCGLQFDLQKAITPPLLLVAAQAQPPVAETSKTRVEIRRGSKAEIPAVAMKWWQAMLKRGVPMTELYPMATQVKPVATLRGTRRSHNKGTVKWFNAHEGLGFIAPDDGSINVLFEVKARQRADVGALKSGAKVVFKVGKDVSTQLRHSAKLHRK